MRSFLDNIRKPEKHISIQRQIMHTIGVLVLGIILGTFSKWLDCMPSNQLPYLMEYLDIRNFLGRFAFWIFMGVCISIYSSSALRAAVNVFVFFTGMVGSYYLYSKFAAGFFPRAYAMIWVGFTIVSFFLAFICWYAKGKGKPGLMICAGIVGVLFNTAFAYGPGYFDVRYVLELILFCVSIWILKRTWKETLLMTGIGIVFAFLLRFISPFQF